MQFNFYCVNCLFCVREIFLCSMDVVLVFIVDGEWYGDVSYKGCIGVFVQEMNVVVYGNILGSLCFFEVKRCLLVFDNSFLKFDFWMLCNSG